MADVQMFDVMNFHTAKASAVPVTATDEIGAQTVVSLVTPSLPAGLYMIDYAFQVTFSEKNKLMHFGLKGTFPDAELFGGAVTDNTELHANRRYGYPKQFAGGVVTMDLVMYKDPTMTSLVADFADVFIQRVG